MRIGMSLLTVACALFMTDVPGRCADDKPVEGTLVLFKRTYQLTRIVAYEDVEDGKPVITVQVSDMKLPLEKIKAHLKDPEGVPGYVGDQPHVRVSFDKEGKPVSLSYRASNLESSRDSGINGELKLDAGRVKGSVKVAGGTSRDDLVEFRFDVGLGVDQAPKMPVAKKPTVSGKFVANGKDVKIGFVSVTEHVPYQGEDTLKLVFTEKELPKGASPPKSANSVTVLVTDYGRVLSSKIVHSGLKKSLVDQIGINARGVLFSDGEITGRVEGSPFEPKPGADKWEFILDFSAPFVPTPPKPGTKKRPQVKKTEKKSAQRPSKGSNLVLL